MVQRFDGIATFHLKNTEPSPPSSHLLSSSPSRRALALPPLGFRTPHRPLARLWPLAPGPHPVRRQHQPHLAQIFPPPLPPLNSLVRARRRRLVHVPCLALLDSLLPPAEFWEKQERRIPCRGQSLPRRRRFSFSWPPPPLRRGSGGAG